MKYLYGPIKSRRLGTSLGINLTSYKTCSFNCVYCQLGKTNNLTVSRSEYIKIDEIFDELRVWFDNHKEDLAGLGYITISGSGEPTLNTKISDLINQIRKISSLKIAVITNSSLLADASLRREILGVDLIVPSLDAVTQELFVKVNRPHQAIKVDDIIKGLIALRREFRGKIWLEVMLVKSLNDDIRHIRKLKEAIDRINPDKIQINSPVRTPSEEGVFSVAKSKLKKIKDILGDKAEII
ncbi:MAG: radical SAM protein [Candidatus Omnitrophica bacterium CG08_land_8_20_14_0_20_41_16]|uniref:Radical SAM protein n=1 Tax=Candidatus Sherwoodlollariibacterium unditelluris TaxID=1974757 RepID=A0A2G9YMD8_9BACT|nr:MAG: radical SAM protein [Candidatus Omnitrophica bacterium CG23_combo_of_CG06-09_8_20_14_all_41_10]PIS33777.1 MAG: radical SAM protein [Candidatus Omnitrophica bacterium CG08_land_8_20_14_0_20_41_16]